MKKIELLLVGVIAINISACAVTAGNYVDLAKLDMTKFCSTTETEFLDLVGSEPLQKGFQSGYNTMTWSYSSVSGLFGDNIFQTVVAFFNQDNILVDYIINPIGTPEVNDQC